MGFIGSSSARELDAQAELQQPPTDEIDYEIDIDYELELELTAEESESESDFEDDAPAPTRSRRTTRPTSSSSSSVNKHDSRSPTAATKPTYNNNDVSQSNDNLRTRRSKMGVLRSSAVKIEDGRFFDFRTRRSKKEGVLRLSGPKIEDRGAFFDLRFRRSKMGGSSIFGPGDRR